jgi:hypothetical protein
MVSMRSGGDRFLAKVDPEFPPSPFRTILSSIPSPLVFRFDIAVIQHLSRVDSS